MNDKIRQAAASSYKASVDFSGALSLKSSPRSRLVGIKAGACREVPDRMDSAGWCRIGRISLYFKGKYRFDLHNILFMSTKHSFLAGYRGIKKRDTNKSTYLLVSQNS